MGGYALIIPGSDRALQVISAHRDRLEPHAPIALPAHATVLGALDKLRFAEAAAVVGLDTPETVVCFDAEEALSAADTFGYPVLVKSRRVVDSVAATLARPLTARVDGPEQLARVLPAYGNPCLVQRVVRGTLIDYGGYG